MLKGGAEGVGGRVERKSRGSRREGGKEGQREKQGRWVGRVYIDLCKCERKVSVN